MTKTYIFGVVQKLAVFKRPDVKADRMEDAAPRHVELLHSFDDGVLDVADLVHDLDYLAALVRVGRYYMLFVFHEFV